MPAETHARSARNAVKLLELAYCACFVSVASLDHPLRREHEKYKEERDRLAAELGLEVIDRKGALEELQQHWLDQLPLHREREIFRMGVLLVRQHALLGYLQTHPKARERMHICLQLEQIQRVLKDLFRRYRLRESVAKLPDIPLPGSAEGWMDWSGDALLDSILAELGGGSKAASA